MMPTSSAALLVERGGACAVLMASRSSRVARDGQGLEGQLRSVAAAAVLATDGATAPHSAAQCCTALYMMRALYRIQGPYAVRLRLSYVSPVLEPWHSTACV